MRRLSTFSLVILALSVAAPAAAQIVGRHDYGRVGTSDPFLGNGRIPGPTVRDELRDVDRRIDRARESGTISGREARQLRREAGAIVRLAGVYRHGGFSASERFELQARFLYLRGAINRPRPVGPVPEQRRGR